MRFTANALKRGYTVADVEHVLANYIDVFEDQGLLELTVFVGPTANGEMLEVGAEIEDGAIDRIAHVMPVRAKYLRRKR